MSHIMYKGYLYQAYQSTKDKHRSYLDQDKYSSFKHTPQGKENKQYGVDEELGTGQCKLKSQCCALRKPSFPFKRSLATKFIFNKIQAPFMCALLDMLYSSLFQTKCNAESAVGFKQWTSIQFSFTMCGQGFIIQCLTLKTFSFVAFIFF